MLDAADRSPNQPEPAGRKRGRPAGSGWFGPLGACVAQLERAAIDKWSERETIDREIPRTGRRILDNVAKILECLAGGTDEIPMFMGALQKAHPHLFDSPAPVIARIRDAYLDSNRSCDRASFVQFVCDSTHTQIVRDGFVGVGYDLLGTVREQVQSSGYCSADTYSRVCYADKGGRPPLSEDEQAKIAQEWEHASDPAKGSLRDSIPDARILRGTQTSDAIDIAAKLDCSLSAAVKYRPANVLDPIMADDLCHHCEDLHHLEDQLERRTKQLREKYKAEAGELEDMMAMIAPTSPLTPDEKTAGTRMLIDAAELRFHKEVEKRQRAAFDAACKKALRPDSKLIVILEDYKAMVTLGHGPRKLHNAYYGYSSSSVHGAVVWMPGCQGPIYVDSVSSNLKHSAAVSEMILMNVLEELRKSHADAFHSCEEIQVWSDNAPHFRALSNLYATLVRVPTEFPGFKVASQNFFCEYHGKSWCDEHFATVSYYLRAKSKRMQLINHTDVVEGIRDGNATTNKLRAARGERPAEVIVLEYGATDEASGRRALRVQNYKHSYCYQMEVEPGRFLNKHLSDNDAPTTLVVEVVDVDPRKRADGDAIEGEPEDEPDDRLTRWARDVAVPATTNWALFRKKNRALRKALPPSDLTDQLQRVATGIKELSAAAEAVLAAGRVRLPSRRADAENDVERLLNEAGRAVVVTEDGVPTLGTSHGAVSDHEVEIVYHRTFGPESTVISIDDAIRLALPRVGLHRKQPSMFFLAANYFSGDGANIFDSDPTSTAITCWVLCTSCKRWRIVPAAVYRQCRKRGEVFKCSTVHTRGCAEPQSRVEQSWHRKQASEN